MTSVESSEPAPYHVLEIVGNAVVGGVERHAQTLVESLLKQGFKVSAICPFEGYFASALRADGCQVYIAMLEEAMEWRSLLTAVEIVRRQQVDLIHAHMFNAAFVGSLAGSLLGVPVVITDHGMYISPEEMALARLTGSHLITVCTSAYMMGLSMGLPEDQLSLIPNAVDTERFRPDLDGHAFREQLHVPDDAPLVGMVARLAHEKGPDLFIQAALLVASVRPDAHFVLVGDGPLRAQLAREIQVLGLGNRLHLAGQVADTSTVYPALDVVCLASRLEGQPLTLIEAMAAERPVVAANVGGVPELVQMGETGWLVAQGDMTAMSERILWLLDNPAEAAEMGRGGRRRVQESFDVRRQTVAVSRLFWRLAKNRRPQAMTTLRLGKVHSRARVS